MESVGPLVPNVMDKAVIANWKQHLEKEVIIQVAISENDLEINIVSSFMIMNLSMFVL